MKTIIQLSTILLVLLAVNISTAQIKSAVEIRNEVTVGTDHFFDVYLYGESTSSDPIYLTGSDFVFTYDVGTVAGPVTFSKVPHPSPPIGQVGYCNFTSVNHTVVADFSTVVNVQFPTYNGTSTSIVDGRLIINMTGATPSTLSDLNNLAPLITVSCDDNNRLGRFKLTGSSAILSNPNITVKLSGGGLNTQVFTTETSTPFNSFPTTVFDRCVVFPVEMSRFEAQKEGTSVRLDWRTETETDHSRFEIERSADGFAWMNVGTKFSVGNSLESQNYTFEDRNPLAGINYYRLRSIDADESFDFSEVRSVKMPLRSEELSVYPNPATSTVAINIPSSNAQIQLFDVSGRMVRDFGILAPDQSELVVSLTDLPIGIYFVKSLVDGEVSAVSFVKK